MFFKILRYNALRHIKNTLKIKQIQLNLSKKSQNANRKCFYKILPYSASRIINLPEFLIIAQPKSIVKALNDEAGSQLMVGVSNPHTSRPAEPDAGNETLPGANALSPTASKIISNSSAQSQMRINPYKQA